MRWLAQQSIPMNSLPTSTIYHRNPVSLYSPLMINRSFHLLRRKNTQKKQEKADTTIPVELDEKRTNSYFQLQMIYRDDSMSAKVKAQRLREKLLEVISTLDNGQFPANQLDFVNNVVNFIDQGRKPTDSFTVDQMMKILESVMSAMSAKNMQYLNFFPRFYSSLRETNKYNQDRFMRMQLFEIFLNYALLSGNRKSLPAILDAFIDEEQNLRGIDVREDVVNVVLEAFKSVAPDTGTVVHLAELSDLTKHQQKIATILERFFQAADFEISDNYEGNDVSDNILQLLDIFEQKIDCPMAEYINLLYFTMRNGFDSCCMTIMEKLSRLTNKFTDEHLLDKIRKDEFMAIVSSALKYKDYDGAATKLIKNLESHTDFQDFHKGEWIGYYQHKLYYASNDSEQAIQIVKDLNEKLENKYHTDYLLNDTDSYNYALESFCYSNRSPEFIDSFTHKFDDLYQLTRDSRSFAILIMHFLDLGNIKESLDLFERSLQEAIAWDDDYGGMYVPVLFRLLADYFNKSDDDLFDKTQLYKKIKTFDYAIDKKSLFAMVQRFLKGNFVGDAMEIFEREIPSLKKKDAKYDIDDYKDLFELYYRYAVTNCENLRSNWLLYEFLSKFFYLPYEYYPAFLKFWVDVGYPSKALKVFADMKQLSKENKLEPPGEEIYLYLLQSFGKLQYGDGIVKLELAVKMDLSLNIDIELLNTLMGAFCSLEDSFRVRDVFNLAQTLPEEHGLNQESCYWALKSLKFTSLREINNFYTNLSQYDILPDANIFGEYLIGHCYYEQFGTAYEKLVDTYENGGSHLIDRNVLKNFFNFCSNAHVRQKIDHFATENYPKIWTDLKKSGELITDPSKKPSLLDNPYEAIQLRIKN